MEFSTRFVSFLILSSCVTPRTLPATALLCVFCTLLAPSRLPVMFSGSASLMDPIHHPWMRVSPPLHLLTHFQLPLLINHHLLTPPELSLTITILQTQSSPKFQVFHLGLKPQPSFLKRICFPEAIGILLEFYSVQDQEMYPYLSSIISVRFILFLPAPFLASRRQGSPPSPANSEGAIVCYSGPSGSTDEFKRSPFKFTRRFRKDSEFFTWWTYPSDTNIR